VIGLVPLSPLRADSLKKAAVATQIDQ
jgi:hypothetical protein